MKKKIIKKINLLILVSVLTLNTCCHMYENISEDVLNDEYLSKDIIDTALTSDKETQIEPESIPLSLIPESLDDLLYMTNTKRANIIKPSMDNFGLLSEWDNESIGHWEGGIAGRVFSEEDIYTVSEAEEDIELLFDVFKHTYGAYFYFGGDDVFSAAKENIMLEIRNEESLSGRKLQNIVMNNLSFIKDGHCYINGMSFHNVLFPYVCNDAEFGFDTIGFYNKESSKRIASIDGDKNFYTNMKLSFNESSELVYRYISLADKTIRECTVTYDDNTTERLFMKKMDLQKPNKHANEPPPVLLEYINGIPVIRVREMGFEHTKNDKDSNLFLQYAEEFKNAPVLIIDLRINSGGNGILPIKWMETFAGEMVTTNSYELRRTTMGMFFGFNDSIDNADSSYFVPLADIKKYLQPKTLSDTWQIERNHEDNIVPHKGLLILLVSKNTASAGECFVDLAYNLENSLVIGTNTLGLLRSSLSHSVSLPNTGLKLSFGNNVNYFPEGYFEEFAGIEPDIWTTGDAEEEIFMYLEKNLSDAN